MYPTKDQRDDFYAWVAAEIGEDAIVRYPGKFSEIPTVQPQQELSTRPVCVPLACFSFGEDCGLTGAPELEKSRLLLGFLCAYGFESQDEVVKIRFPVTCFKRGELGDMFQEVVFFSSKMKYIHI